MEKNVGYSYLKRADALIDINRFQEAIIELHKFLTYFPENYDAFCKLSLCFYELNELQKSIEFSKKAVESNPLGEWAYRLQSIIYRASGNHQKSFDAAENCIKQSLFSLYSMQNLAYSQINLFRLDKAQKTIDEMLKTFPNEWLTHDACGYFSMRKEDWKTAEKHLLKALKIEPNSEISLNNLGSTYINQAKSGSQFGNPAKNHQKAIKYFELAIKTKPTFLLAQENLKVAKITNFYLGSPMFWAMIKNICLLIISLFLLRISFELIPLIINYFIPYKPHFFYLFVNFIFILYSFFMFIFVIHYYYLKLIAYQVQNRFENRSKLYVVVSLLFITIPQFLGSFFIAIIELDAPDIIWLLYILFAIGVFIGVLKLFQFVDNKEII